MKQITKGLELQEHYFNQIAKEIICLFNLDEFKNSYEKKLNFLLYEFRLRFVHKDFLKEISKQEEPKEEEK